MLSPLLPLSLIVGQAASSKRLIDEMEIFCVDPNRISICGKIRVCCFDKTGTLTKVFFKHRFKLLNNFEEGLDFLGTIIQLNIHPFAFLGCVPLNEGGKKLTEGKLPPDKVSKV